jgi:hypothetical protein
MHDDFSYADFLLTRAERDALRARQENVIAALRALTPAARRLLARLLAQMNMSGGAPVNRAAIARQLQRPGGLGPHDITLLKRLERAELIRCKRRRLKPLPPHNLGRGSEFVYWIDDETTYILNRLAEKRRAAADQRKSA